MSADSFVKNLLEILKHAPKIFFAVFLAGIIIIVAPDELANKFGLLQFRSEFAGYIGGVTLLSGCLLIAHLGVFLYDRFAFHWRARRVMRSLTPEEQSILRPYILNHETTQSFHISDGTHKGLVANGVLYRATDVSAPGGMSFAYLLQPWARKYLRKRPNLLSS